MVTAIKQSMHTDAANLEIALNWLKSLLEGLLKLHLKHTDTFEPSPIKFYSTDSWLNHFIERHQPSMEEFVVLMLAIVPHIKPHFFNELIAEHLPEGGDFPEFGGVKGLNHRGILPTGETAQFLLAGNKLKKRLEIQGLLSDEHWLQQNRIVWLETVREGDPFMSGRLILDMEIVELLTLGRISKPRFSMNFPAEHLETEMEWDDLVLHPSTLRQIHEIENWIKHNDTLLHAWGMKKKLKPGYRALFHGPPGTGKTLTTMLLGKYTDRPVFRIDLSRVVSKYIGETEQNLSRLFDKAENKNWILFFDEADALFGKRTDVRDAHDKYANQEVAYLLQRIETYNGLTILATNQRGHIDDAFARRFQNIIHFPLPRPDERVSLWLKAFPKQITIADDVDWRQIASRFELTGAAIMSVAHFCAIEALADQSCMVDLKRLESAVLREYVKEGKVV